MSLKEFETRTADGQPGYCFRMKGCSIEEAKALVVDLLRQYPEHHIILVDDVTGMKLADSKAMVS